MRRRRRRTRYLFDRVRECPTGQLPMVLDALLERIAEHLCGDEGDDLDSAAIRDVAAVGRAYDAIRAVVVRTVGRGIDYKAYLRSSRWLQLRGDMLETAGHRCQVCNRPGLLNVHHRTYERIGVESPEDLIVLCEPCHTLFHENGRLARP